MLPSLAATELSEKHRQESVVISEGHINLAGFNVATESKQQINLDTSLQDQFNQQHSQTILSRQHKFAQSEVNIYQNDKTIEKELKGPKKVLLTPQQGRLESWQNQQEMKSLDQIKLRNNGRVGTKQISQLKYSEQLKMQKEQTTNTLKRLKTFDLSKVTKVQREVTMDVRQKINKFDGATIPPNFDKARAHRLAAKVGQEKDINEMTEDEDIEYCECCARQIQRQQLSVKCNIYQLSFLGSGYPLYFQFMKQCMMLLTLVLLSSGLFNVVTNILGRESCKNSTTTTGSCNKGGWISLFSLGSKSQQKTFMEVQGYLNLASLVAMIFLLQFFRKLQRELDTKCDAEDIAANDYTLIIKKIPVDYEAINDDYDDDLKEFIEQHGLDDKEIEVQSVTLCYSLKEINILENKKMNLIRRKQKLLQKMNELKKKFLDISQKTKDSQDTIHNHSLPKQSFNANSFTQCLVDFKSNEEGITGKRRLPQLGLFPEESIADRSIVDQLQERKINSTFSGQVNQTRLQGQISPTSTNKMHVSLPNHKLQEAINDGVSLHQIETNKAIESRDKSSFFNNQSNYNSTSTKLTLKQLRKQETRRKSIIKLSSRSIALNKTQADYNSAMERIDLHLKAVARKQHLLNDKLMDGKGRPFMRQYFTGIAFVCLRFEQDKEEIIDKYRPIGFFDKLLSKIELKPSSMIYHDQKLVVQQAPDPTDVCWVNLHYSSGEKVKRQIQGFFFTAACLLGCAFAIYVFHDFQETSLESGVSDGSLKKQLVSSMLAVLISILNALLSFILQVTSDYCKYSTRTEMNIFVAKGLSVARFINSAIISFVIQVVLSSKNTQDALFGEGGLAENANYFMISNSFVTAIAQMLNLDYYWRLFLRFLEKKKGENSVLTQLELNELYENPQFPIEERYAQLLMTMFTTAFYYPIVPMTIFWSLIGIFLQYWIDKYKLIHRSSVRYNMSAELSIEMTEHLEYFLPIQSISTLIFYQYVNGGSWGLSSILGTILGLLHAFLPMQMINERLFSVEKADANVLDYEGASKFFITDYSRENPIYKVSARQTHVMKMKEQITNQRTSLKKNTHLGKLALIQKHKVRYDEPERNMEEVQDEESQKGKRNSENSSQGQSNVVILQPPTIQTDKQAIFISHNIKGNNDNNHSHPHYLSDAKTSETIILFEEDPSTKQAPQESTANVNKRNYLVNRASTNETNLNLVEGEEDENAVRANGIQSINSPTYTHNNILNTFQFTSQQYNSQDIHLSNLVHLGSSNGISYVNADGLRKKYSFGPVSICDKQQKKLGEEFETGEIQTPTHPLPRSANHHGFQDATDLALTERETFRATRSPNTKTIGVHPGNELSGEEMKIGFEGDGENNRMENLDKNSWRQLDYSDRSSHNNMNMSGIQSDLSGRPFNSITKGIESLSKNQQLQECRNNNQINNNNNNDNNINKIKQMKESFGVDQKQKKIDSSDNSFQLDNNHNNSHSNNNKSKLDSGRSPNDSIAKITVSNLSQFPSPYFQPQMVNPEDIQISTESISTPHSLPVAQKLGERL